MATKRDDHSVDIKSSELLDKRIAFGITGSIAAVEAVKQIRELRRHGAEVYPFYTSGALQFITAVSLGWAANRPAIGQLTETCEHLLDFDFFVVSPCSWNSMAKIASGISDNAVLMAVSCHLSRARPLILAPSLHETLTHHPLYLEIRKRLVSMGVSFVETEPEEGKLKAPSAENLAKSVIGTKNLN
jgi:phosphopantothenoylcysteine decarboxylase/phosphopantothenate--cysteine ligase